MAVSQAEVRRGTVKALIHERTEQAVHEPIGSGRSTAQLVRCSTFTIVRSLYGREKAKPRLSYLVDARSCKYVHMVISPVSCR